MPSTPYRYLPPAWTQTTEEFGWDIVFWGPGCEARPYTLRNNPAGGREVKRRIDDLAPGGGSFGPIHNVQTEVPAQNTITMFMTAREYGIYHR
jgi:uroporphyrinogen decarboxylase